MRQPFFNLPVLLNIGFSLFGLFALCVLGGVYALVASAVAQRLGPRGLWGTWLVTSVGIAIAGALRILGVQRDAGVDPARVSVPGLYSLIGVAMLITLSVPTLFIWRRRTRALESGPTRTVVTGMAGTVVGLVLMLIVALVLDLLNVPFIPMR